MRRADAAPAEQLNHYWNGRGDAEPTATLPPLDPSLIGALEALYARDDARLPDARALDRVEQALREEMARGKAVAQRPPIATIGPNGRIATMTSPARPTTRAQAPRWSHGWALQQVAMAALILLTLLGSLVAIRALLHPTTQDDPVLNITAIDDTPEAAALPGAVEETTLLQGTFETLPKYTYWEGIARATLAPGAAFDLGKSENDGEGPMLYRIEFGELTINADGPISVTRAGGGEATTIPAGMDVVLREGDRGYTPSGVTSRWRNDRQVPAVVLDAGFATGGYGALPAGVTHEAVVAGYGTPAKGPVSVSVRRVTLGAGRVLAADAVPGLKLVYLESGQIAILDAEHLALAANPLRTGAPGKGVRLLNGGPVFTGSIPAGVGIRAADSGPATLLIMTVMESGASGTAPMG